ncbi:polygalacturonase 1 beta-like protein 3 isoform X1 [Prunus yedoensis var. nudiflora]|uniref:Polygalacturonase 1 beta-like protein 3 isoform X1 n=1 Tax=Prunus yedoensis var. nudiflora TaxID=2094558 RepID=A0A314Y390_PRUYE|nr:polygalacturonase 1 beta-like protein 3 isoform X1 [Prunus yedoensis var. nudiflora]
MNIFLLFLLSSLLPFKVTSAQTKTNPFTPKASLNRYWDNHISNNLPKPNFLFSKASPLDRVNSAILTQLAAHNSLSAHFASFCSLANLYCSFDPPSAQTHQQDLVSRHFKDANFAAYSNKNFANYGSSQLDGGDSFKNYSDGLNSPYDSFKKYSKDANSHSEKFTFYAHEANVANASFTNYGADSAGGSGEFTSYDDRVNVPNLRFAAYDSDANNHRLSFTGYSHDTNSGSETFVSYGKTGNANPTEFSSYAEDANIIGSGFTGYGESGTGQNDSFKGYGQSANNPHNNFKSYGGGGTSGSTGSRIIGAERMLGMIRFSLTREIRIPGRVRDRSKGRTSVGFKSYGLGRSFKEYAKNGVTFAEYSSLSKEGTKATKTESSGSLVNKWVEPGKFFRESLLKQGNAVVMPDIRDKMPERSFLPRGILSKLPFSTPGMSELREIFHARDKSAMEHVLTNALAECERSPSPGETKRCVGSIEDMIDFATSVLGHNVVVRTTENVSGSKQKVMIGMVSGINGGNVTKSVSCHQTLYPYLLYYCHYVPKARVYEADIVDVESKSKINHGWPFVILTRHHEPGTGAFVGTGGPVGRLKCATGYLRMT